MEFMSGDLMARIFFLQCFKEVEIHRQVKRNRTTLSLFSQDYLKYSASIHTAKALTAKKTAALVYIIL
jgi:hypothetical protein